MGLVLQAFLPSPRPCCCGPLPALLALHQLAVGGDLNIQGQLGVHKLLVLAQLPGHVLLGLLQGVLQLGQLGLGVLESQLTLLLGLLDVLLQFQALQPGGQSKESVSRCGRERAGQGQELTSVLGGGRAKQRISGYGIGLHCSKRESK